MRLEGEYTITNWNQTNYDASANLDEATISLEYRGDISGTASTRYLMARLPDGAAEFTGLVRIDGAVGNRKGSFLLVETGHFDGAATARGTLTIVAGSGTGDLTSIRGSGAYVATHGEASVEFAGRTWQPTANGIASCVMDIELD